MDDCTALLRDMLLTRDKATLRRLLLSDLIRGGRWSRAFSFWTSIWLIALDPWTMTSQRDFIAALLL